MNLDLTQMTTADKLRAMELIWNDLLENVPDMPSPAWHAEVLKEREEQLARGELEFIDWETAKRQIRDAVS